MWIEFGYGCGMWDGCGMDVGWMWDECVLDECVLDVGWMWGESMLGGMDVG